MILKLMRRDLLMNWTMPLWIAGSIVANLVLWAINGGRTGSVLAFGSFIAAFFPVMVSGREDRFRTNASACSLPVGRWQIVLARYLLGPALFPGWMLLCVLMIWVLAGFRLPDGVLHPDTFVTALAVQMLTVAVLTPLMLRFGLIGFLYGLIGLQVLSLIVLLAGPRIGLRGGILAIEDAVRRVGPGLRGLRASLGDAAWYPAAFATVAAVFGLSFALSFALFRRRDL
jgi:hypothetical protein